MPVQKCSKNLNLVPNESLERRSAAQLNVKEQQPPGRGPDALGLAHWVARLAIFALTAAINPSIPPPLRTEEYSERRSATSLTEPSE